VNAYDDERQYKGNLLEGSVKINSASQSGILKPGQQAQVTHDIKILDNVDVEDVMVGKTGYFFF